MSKTIGIVGNGFVGKATALLECDNVKVLMYDIDPEKCSPPGTTLKTLVDECDVVFVCVPTPMMSSDNPRTNTSIVENVLKELQYFREKKHSFKESLKHALPLKVSGETGDERFKRSEYCHFVVRSTVPVGFCALYEAHHFPEFLTEKNYMNDFRTAKEWVIGVNHTLVTKEHQQDFKNNIMKILLEAHQSGRISSHKTIFESTNCTELAKYARNSFLATKISFCNELADFADEMGVNYESLQNIFTLDTRIGSSHTDVPGHDGKRGWGGTCFPKDVMSLLKQYEDKDLEGHVIKGVLRRNLNIDRPEKEWEKLVGRSISE